MGGATISQSVLLRKDSRGERDFPFVLMTINEAMPDVSHIQLEACSCKETSHPMITGPHPPATSIGHTLRPHPPLCCPAGIAACLQHDMEQHVAIEGCVHVCEGWEGECVGWECMGMGG